MISISVIALLLFFDRNSPLKLSNSKTNQSNVKNHKITWQVRSHWMYGIFSCIHDTYFRQLRNFFRHLEVHVLRNLHVFLRVLRDGAILSILIKVERGFSRASRHLASIWPTFWLWRYTSARQNKPYLNPIICKIKRWISFSTFNSDVLHYHWHNRHIAW